MASLLVGFLVAGFVLSGGMTGFPGRALADEQHHAETEEVDQAQRLAGAEKQRLRALYLGNCGGCHGAQGDGKESRALGYSIPDFTSPATATELTQDRIIAAMRSGHSKITRSKWAGDFTEVDEAQLAAHIEASFMRPSPSPGSEMGRRIFARTCSVCHGDNGDAASWAQRSLNPPPADFTSAKLREMERRKLINAVTYGRSNTAMMGFATQLSEEEIASVVDYVRETFMGIPAMAATGGEGAHDDHGPGWDAGGHKHPEGKIDFAATFDGGLSGDLKRGGDLYRMNCAACHGEKGDGKGPRAYFMREKPEDFTSPEARAELNRPHLFEAISKGVLRTEMPAWSKALADQQIVDVAEYVFTSFVRPEAQQGHGADHDGGQEEHGRQERSHEQEHGHGSSHGSGHAVDEHSKKN